MKFAETHEWVKVEGDLGTVGVSKHAQGELGDIVYVELPDVGAQVSAGEDSAVLESTKAAADVYSPVSGEVVEVNEALVDSPETVNEASEAEGWLFKVKLSDPSELDSLMDMKAYEGFVNNGEGATK